MGSGRGRIVAVLVGGGVFAAGCLEDAWRTYRDNTDAGSASDAGLGIDAGGRDAGPTDAGRPDAGLTDAGHTDSGASDSGPGDAGVTGADAGAPDAGGCDSGCTTDWPTFLKCGPLGQTLCVPHPPGSVAIPTYVSFHGPAQGATGSAIAFAEGALVWTTIAGDGGISLLASHTAAQNITSLAVADTHHDDPSYVECVDAVFTFASGGSLPGGYLFSCNGWVDAGTLSLASPSVSGASWIYSDSGVVHSVAAASGQSTSPFYSYDDPPTGSPLTFSGYLIDQVQGVNDGPGTTCTQPGAPDDWWIFSRPGASLLAVQWCSNNDYTISANIPVTDNVRMTAGSYLPEETVSDAVANVVGWDGGYLFAFPIDVGFTTGLALWVDAGVPAIKALEIERWGPLSNSIGAGFLDQNGNPYFAAVDMDAGTWTGPFRVPNTAGGYKFIAPLYPHMVLLQDTTGNLSIHWLP